MNEARKRRIAKGAIVALLLSVAACDEPAKNASDANHRDREGVDKSGSGDKSHCGGDEKH